MIYVTREGVSGAQRRGLGGWVRGLGDELTMMMAMLMRSVGGYWATRRRLLLFGCYSCRWVEQ